MFKYLFFLLMSCLSLQSFALVTYVVSDPEVTLPEESNFHTKDGPIYYTIDYATDDAPLNLVNDPGYFELLDEDYNLSFSSLFVSAPGIHQRSILLQNFPNEGTYHLRIKSGTATDNSSAAIPSGGSALENDIVSFTVDRTLPQGKLIGPFADESLTLPLTEVNQDQEVYFELDYTPDTSLPVERQELLEADEFSLLNTENTWVRIFFTISVESVSSSLYGDYSARIYAKRNGAKYLIRMTNLSGLDGKAYIRADSNIAYDYAGNQSPVVSSSHFVVVDPAGPEINLSRQASSLSAGEPVEFYVQYENANTINIDESYITVHTTNGLVATNISVVKNIFQQTATVTLSNFIGDGEISISVAAGSAADREGDLSNAAGPSQAVRIDTHGPTVTFSDPTPLATEFGPVTYSIDFESAVAVTLLPADVNVITTGNVSYDTMELFHIDVDTKQIKFSGLQGEGEIYFNVPANVAIDQWFKPSVASGNSPSVMVGPIVPLSMTIAAPNPSHTINDPVTFEVSYKGASVIHLDNTYINLIATGTAVASSINVSGLGLDKTVTLDGITGNGTLAIELIAGSAVNNDGDITLAVISSVVAVGNADADGDGVPDSIEDLDPDSSSTDALSYKDSDGDLVPDYIEEFVDFTDKHDKHSYKDSDKGLTPDYVESILFANLGLLVTDEFSEHDDQQDSDSDGLPDYLELLLADHNPLLGNYVVDNSSFPVVSGHLDDDADGIPNGLEFYLTKLLNKNDITPLDDFDRDGFFSHQEVLMGLQPDRSSPYHDDDNDGIANRVEAAALADLLSGNLAVIDDSDFDGIPDYLELVNQRSDANYINNVETYISTLLGGQIVDIVSDFDLDGLSDIEELKQAFSPIIFDLPAVSLVSVQGLNAVCAVSRNQTSAEVSIRHHNSPLNIASVTWNAPELTLASGIGSDLAFSFNPSLVSAGIYKVTANINRVHNGVTLTAAKNHYVNIIDGDNQADLDENFICDSSTLVLPAYKNQMNTSLGSILTDYQSSLSIGSLAKVNASNQAVLTASEVDQAILTMNASQANSADVLVAPVLNVSVSHFALQKTDSSASLYLPISIADAEKLLNTELTYSVLINNSWQSFLQENGNALFSSAVACDSEAVFSPGVIEAAQCIKLTVVDGGQNDFDGRVNGHVELVVSLTELDIPGSGGGTGGNGPSDNARKVKVNKAGAASPLFLLFFSALLFARRLLRSQAYVLAILMLSSFMVQAESESNLEPEYELDPNVPWTHLSRFHIGASVGQSSFEPDHSSLYKTLDDSDIGFKINAFYSISPRWFVDVQYADLGTSSLYRTDINQENNIAYSTTSLSGYFIQPLFGSEKWRAFAKAGIGHTTASSKFDVEVSDPISPNLGAGVMYEFIDGYTARVEFETFSQDNSFLSIGIAKRLGKPPVRRVEAEPEAVVAEEPGEPVEVAKEKPKAAEQLRAEAIAAQIETFNKESEIFSRFAKGYATLTPDMREGLTRMANFLKEYPEVNLEILGHTCDIGHENYNEKVGGLRAEKAQSFLLQLDVAEGQLKVDSEGEDIPLYKNDSDEHRSLNRRIELKFTAPEPEVLKQEPEQKLEKNAE